MLFVTHAFLFEQSYMCINNKPTGSKFKQICIFTRNKCISTLLYAHTHITAIHLKIKITATPQTVSAYTLGSPTTYWSTIV